MIKVLILGGGFAGLAALLRLVPEKGLDITLVDKSGESNFPPMLPDVIGRGINADFLTFKIEDLRKRFKFNFINDEVNSVDLKVRQVKTSKYSLNYDYLIIATGSETNFYGQQYIRDYAYKLDMAQDAKKILTALRDGLFDAVIVAGGGYTGIEVATNLRVYFNKNQKKTKVIIVERAPSILGPLPEWMKNYTQRNLKNLNINVFINTVIEKIEGYKVCLSNNQTFDNAMLIWAAGVKTAGFIERLNFEKNPQGRLKVDEYLRLEERSFAVGDAAGFLYKDKPLRMAVQFSIMEGRHAAKNVLNVINGRPLRAYRPLDLGYIIPMANNRSCGCVLGLNLRGVLATFLHYLMCIYRSHGFRNKWGILGNLMKGGNMLTWVSLFLRMGLGLIFVAHGTQKVFGSFGGPGIKGFSQMLSGLGFVPAVFWAYLAAYVELLGGICLILGLYTRIAASLIFILITVATITVHLSKGFFLSAGGYEYNLLILCACIALIIAGGGEMSITKKF